MIRQRLAALAVASTIAFGATAIHIPTAAAEPEQPQPAAAQMSALPAFGQFKEMISLVISLPPVLSSAALAYIAGPDHACSGLIPQYCPNKK